MTLSAFNGVLSDLEELGLEENEGGWDDEISDRLIALEAYYGNQNLRNVNRELIDYSGLPTQAAYVFMYAIGRAEFTYSLLKRFREKVGHPLFPQGAIRVTSLGGGLAVSLRA